CTTAPSAGRAGGAHVTPDRHRGQHHHDQAGAHQPPAMLRLDVPQVVAGPGQLQQAATEQQQQDIGRLPPHRLPPRTTHHAATAQAMATTNVSGANRSANGRPNVPAWRLISLTSTAGPTTRNTNFGSSGKPARE